MGAYCDVKKLQNERRDYWPSVSGPVFSVQETGASVAFADFTLFNFQDLLHAQEPIQHTLGEGRRQNKK